MVLNIGEDGVPRRDEDISDPGYSPTSDNSSPIRRRRRSSPYEQYTPHRNGYTHSNHHSHIHNSSQHNHQISHNEHLSPNHERRSSDHHHQLNGENSREDGPEAPLDFSVRRMPPSVVHYTNGHRDASEIQDEQVDIKPPISPTDSEVGSPHHIAIQDRDDHVKRESNDNPDSNGQYDNRNNGKIGEPKLAVPGLIPISSLPLPAGFPGLPHGFHPGFAPNLGGMLGPIPPLVIDPNMAQRNDKPGETNRKTNHRPFKAYPKDPLSLPIGYFGMPGINALPGLDATIQEDVLKRYKEYVARLSQEHQNQQINAAVNNSLEQKRLHQQSIHLQNNIHLSPQPVSPSPQTQNNHVQSSRSPVDTSSTMRTEYFKPLSHNSSQHQKPHHIKHTNNNLNQTTSSSPQSPQSPQYSDNMLEYGDNSLPHGEIDDNSRVNGHRKKLDQTGKETVKDASYWERRRKNNEAAKRSRDTRRAKEDEIAIRAAFLEQENMKLRVEVAALKNETAKLRCMLYNS